MDPYKLLIVEDDDPFVKIIDLALRGLNFNCDFAADGEAALRKLSQNYYDLVICDFRLPKMHGLEILRAAQERYPDCKKILITAATEEVVDTQLAGLKLLGYLRKPLSPIDLRHLVIEHFG